MLSIGLIVVGVSLFKVLDAMVSIVFEFVLLFFVKCNVRCGPVGSGWFVWLDTAVVVIAAVVVASAAF